MLELESRKDVSQAPSNADPSSISPAGMLEFESRKDLVNIFGALVRIEHNGDHPGLRYVLDNDAILVTLFDGCA